MRAPSSLQGRIALLSAGIFLILFLLAFALVVIIDARNGRRDLEIFLYAEAEALAGYFAASGRLDFPELMSTDEQTPLPTWLRLIGDGETLARTPGMPEIPVAPLTGAALGRLRRIDGRGGSGYVAVSHEVWNRPGYFTEAITSAEVLGQRRRQLVVGLVLAALLLVPLAALGGRLLASRALGPLEDLVLATRKIDPQRLADRLQAPGAVEEVSLLTTEFNRLLDRLEKSVESMKQFTADASHELRTPISILRTGLEVALRKERSAAEYRALLEENLVEIERIQRIVEGLLTLARADRESAAEEPLPVELSEVVTEAVASVRPSADDQQVVLEEHVEPELRVLGNVDQLRLMVVNLLDNAVKFTPAGREIRIELGERGGRAVLTVADQGIGVPRADREKIFDRFFRGSQARASGAGPGGLGLSVVKWVADSHGGCVRLLEDRGPGATFEVDLPLDGDPAENRCADGDT